MEGESHATQEESHDEAAALLEQPDLARPSHDALKLLLLYALPALLLWYHTTFKYL